MLAPEYPLLVQAQLVPALTVLHNFIRIHDPTDESDLHLEHNNIQLREHDYGDDEYDAQDPMEVRNAGTRLHGEIANKMWQDYKSDNRCHA